jgi:hypothetical protein
MPSKSLKPSKSSKSKSFTVRTSKYGKFSSSPSKLTTKKQHKYKKHYCSSCGVKRTFKVPKSFVDSQKKTQKTQKNKKRLSKMSYRDIIKSKKMSVKKMNQVAGGEQCEYLKVQGMSLPDLSIPDQYAKMYNNCDPVNATPAPGGMHPNMTT